VHVDGRDDVAVHLADEHHARDVQGVGVGDPEAVAKLGDHAEAVHEGPDLRPSPVDHDRQHADGLHQHDVFCEGGKGGLGIVGRTGQGVASVLDDDDLAGEAPNVRQRLDEKRRDIGRRGRGGVRAHEVVRFSSR